MRRMSFSVEVDFDDPTTNVQRCRALAIAKPTSEGYWPCWSTINLTTKVYSCEQSKNKQKYDKASEYCEYRWIIDKGGDPKAVLVWSLDTNEVHEVAMANF